MKLIIKSLIHYLKSLFVDKNMQFIYINNLKSDIKMLFNRLFWRNSNKKTKACSIYKTEKNYKIITLYPVSSGIFLEQAPIFILPLNTSIEELKNTIFESINASRLMSYKEFQKKYSIKDYLKILKEKSLKNLYQNSSHCNIYLRNNILEICPSKYSEKYKGFETDEIRSKKMSFSKENELIITKEIINILC
jgi:hypothetical protein